MSAATTTPSAALVVLTGAAPVPPSVTWLDGQVAAHDLELVDVGPAGAAEAAGLTRASRHVEFAGATASTEHLHAALDAVSTDVVLMTGVDRHGAFDIAHALTFAARLAERCGLAHVDVPLPVLTAWHDVDVLAAWRSWLEQRHADVLATHERQVDDYLHHVRYRAVTPSLHGVDVVGGGTVLRLVGRCRRGGADGPEPPADQPVVLLVEADGTVAHSVRTEPNRLSEAGITSWLGFTADVPMADLPAGRFRLAVELPSTPGQPPVRARVNATVGMLLAARTVATGGRRVHVLQSPDKYTLDLLVARSDAPLAALRWALLFAWMDLKTFLRRRTFGGVRMARLLTRPFYARREIWLVGERTDTARDNGFHFFKHLRTTRPDIRAYYVVERDSDAHAIMKPFGRVVVHSSLRHRLLMMHATALVEAYSIKYLVPRQWPLWEYSRQLAWRLGSFRVYLKHGINDKTEAVKRRVSGYDLYFTGVEGETQAVRADSGYDLQVVQAGLARYDALVPTPPSRTVLVMPTWRSYLAPTLFTDESVSLVDFEGSTYQVFMTELLTSPRLHAMLEKHDYRLQFMPHYNLADRLSVDVPAGGRIEVLSSAAPDIQDVMRGCDLFVTDYSSVHFDLAYLGTPLVYSHFDLDEFRAGHAEASWFDHERDGFGPVRYDLDSTLDAVEAYLENGCQREAVYEERAQHAFAFRDRENCARTTEAVETLIATGGMH